jgi:uncharacterized protein YoaH (UPF0181 family)
MKRHRWFTMTQEEVSKCIKRIKALKNKGMISGRAGGLPR